MIFNKLARKQQWTLGLVALVMLLVVLTLLNSYRQSIIEFNTIDFSRQARLLSNNLEKDVNQSLQFLNSTSKMFSVTSGWVSRDQFRDYTRENLQLHPSIRSLEWVPVVRQEDRKNAEEQAELRGFENFTFKEKDRQGNIIPAYEKQQYFPSYYLEPLKTNNPELGFDLGSDAKRMVAINTAIQSQKPASTTKVQLLHQEDPEYGMCLFSPVFIDQNFLGLICISYNLQHLINSNEHRFDDLEIYIFDKFANYENQFLSSNGKAVSNMDELFAHINYFDVYDIPIADRTLSIVCSPVSESSIVALDSGQKLLFIIAFIVWALLLCVLYIFTLRLNEKNEQTALLNKKVDERTRELFVYNKELERKNEELSQFAYIASHDLQEPLRTVLNYCDAVQEDCMDKLDEDEQQYIYFIQRAAKRMRNLIKDLLLFSKVENVQMEYEDINLHNLIEEVKTDLDSQINRLGAEINTIDIPATIRGNSGLLKQLFQNLVSNGLKYTDKNKKPSVVIRSFEKNGERIFEVKDNGIGIDKKYFDKIFIIFQRLHNKNEYEGTGIGLSTCKKIVNKHGGEIWLESEPGVGTSFYFTLSAALAQAA